MTETERAKTFVEKILGPLMSVLAAPIRAFYLAVGHADVAAWALASFTAGGIGFMWVSLVRDLNMPITEARVTSEEARLRETELRITEKEVNLGISATDLTWSLGELNWNPAASEVSMEYLPLPDATKIILGWRRRYGGGGGLESQLIVFDPAGGIVTTTFQFPLEWAAGEDIILSFVQELDTGKRVKWAASGRVETVE